MSHFKNLQFYIPDLQDKKILDIGIGRDRFPIDAVLSGADVTCVEPSQVHIDHVMSTIADESIQYLSRKIDAGQIMNIVKGMFEDNKFPDESFDFINMCELIEHVESPNHLIPKAKRVLKKGGQAYLSVPNRYGFKDPHYHEYFINWIPRSWTQPLIRFLGKEKPNLTNNGRQRLDEMHYFTYRKIMKLLTASGFKAEDMRLIKIKKLYGEGIKGKFVRLVYLFLRPWWFDTFHLLLERR